MDQNLNLELKKILILNLNEGMHNCIIYFCIDVYTSRILRIDVYTSRHMKPNSSVNDGNHWITYK